MVEDDDMVLTRLYPTPIRMLLLHTPPYPRTYARFLSVSLRLTSSISSNITLLNCSQPSK
jgi:hypothetical protein